MADTLKKRVTDFINNNIPAVIRKLLGIASSSKVTEQLGHYIVEGLVKGIDDKVSDAEKAAQIT